MQARKAKAPPRPAEGFRKLLVTTDGSDGACRAVDVAAEIAARYGAELHVAVVEDLPEPSIEPEAGLPMPPAAYEARQLEVHEKWIVDIAMQHAMRPEIHRFQGHLVHSTVEFARQNQVDLVVVSAAGHANILEAIYSELHEAFLGSRVGQIVHLAPCTVMVVR